MYYRLPGPKKDSAEPDSYVNNDLDNDSDTYVDYKDDAECYYDEDDDEEEIKDHLMYYNDEENSENENVYRFNNRYNYDGNAIPDTSVTPFNPLILDSDESDVDFDTEDDITTNCKIVVPYEYTIDDGYLTLSRRVVPGDDENNETNTKFTNLESLIEILAFEGKIRTIDFKRVVRQFYPNDFEGTLTIKLRIFPFSTGLLSHSSSDDIDESINMKFTFVI